MKQITELDTYFLCKYANIYLHIDDDGNIWEVHDTKKDRKGINIIPKDSLDQYGLMQLIINEDYKPTSPENFFAAFARSHARNAIKLADINIAFDNLIF